METERLLLRRFCPADGPALYEYLSDEQVVAFEPYGVYAPEEAQREAERRAGDDAFWAVCRKGDGRLIGNLYFCRQEPEELLTWELGYVFSRQFWGQGYATEAARRILGYGFAECGAHRILALCNPKNPASWRLLERLGMRREGHFFQNVFFERDGQGLPVWLDTYEYAMLAADWEDCKSV